MATETVRPAARHQPWYKILYIQVLIAIVARRPDRLALSRPRQGAEAARRRLHRADQDDDRAGDLLHRGARHLLDGRSEARRPGRPEGADLFRGGLDGGAGGRPDRRRSPAARRAASTSIRPRSIRNRSPPTSPRRRKRASSRICWASSPTAISARSPAAICCRCCWSRSCPALPSPSWARPASRSPTPSTRPPRCSSASSASSCASRRSAPSARWRSPSAPTASARCGTWSR